ncbi:hypothetical protein KUTeg_017816 [Tegillarca granosa]|uniref:Uncharacterized protein n=1 Tax=Tegillarca granosa TaxID=220873 RepID=A0ABQ9EG19_TEGGR|nr:hypothetical protein KUTeg_017816 [Tegillarca granosa]
MEMVRLVCVHLLKHFFKSSLLFYIIELFYFGTLYASLYLGLCIPESCSEAELIYIVNEGTAYDIIYIQIPKQKQKPQQNGYTNSNKYKTELNGIEKDTYEVKDTKCKTHEAGLNHTKEDISRSVTENELTKSLIFRYPRTERRLAGKLIISFSVYTNGKKLLNTKQSPGTITAINGIRFISMTWVILGHTFTIIIYNSSK